MSARLDLSNKRFGRLLAIRSRSVKGRAKWLCLCDCGKTTIVDMGNLLYGRGTRACRRHRSELKGEKNHFFGKHHTPEGRKKMKKPHSFSEESLKKIRLFSQGHIPWNKGKEGYQIAWNKGKSGLSGDKHPMWQGGISFLPYPPMFNSSLKKLIRERDENKCQNPDCEQKPCHHGLNIHHFDYNKENCHPLNLISLCLSCNGKANINRQAWEQLYQEIVWRKAYGRTQEGSRTQSISGASTRFKKEIATI